MRRRPGYSYYGFAGKLVATTAFQSLTRPYRSSRKFRDIRVGTWVTWMTPGGRLSGQVWARAPRSGDWWVVDNEGRAHKVHWKKFSPNKRTDW